MTVCGIVRATAYALATATVFALPRRAAAQVPSQQALQQAVLQNPSLVDSLRKRLQASGLTPEQVRARLAASGYPPDLLDAYMGGVSPGQPTPAPGSQELAAIRALGLGSLGPTPAESIPVDTGLLRIRAESLHARAVMTGNYVFGVDVFRRTTTQFLPTLAGPVPPDYRLGPGDQLILILTGEVDLAYTLQITREGFILIPRAGQVFIANLTLDQLREVLYARLGKVYSRLGRGPDARIHLDVSVANVRINQVYVLGEVRQPGAYQVSALGTALTALYAAGGLTERADVRQIEIRRLNKVVATLDLYPYLLRGDKSNDVRLETGDVVQVPLHGTRAQITGAVLRPAIYELRSGESLPDVLGAAGGFRPDAALARIAIHRIVPMPERGTGPFPRAVLEVSLPPVAASDPPGVQMAGVVVPHVALETGDSIVVDSIAPLDSTYFVAIAGAVNEPGRYPWREGMTLRQLVRFARGPKIGAYLKEAEIARMPADRSRGALAQTVRVPLDSSYLLERDAAGRFVGPPGPAVPAHGAPEVPLEPFDNVLILRQPDFELPRTVTVLGQVRFPGTYALTTRDERLADVIGRAGGLTELAYADGVRFVRVLGNIGRINIDLAKALRAKNSGSNIVLQSGDSITVPEYQPSVKISGAVNAPGSVLWEKGQDLSYYVNAAGGVSYRGDKGKISVRYANGQVRTRRKTLFFSSDPKPGPGSEVFVPARDTTSHSQTAAILGAIASAVGALTTIIVVAVNHP